MFVIAQAKPYAIGKRIHEILQHPRRTRIQPLIVKEIPCNHQHVGAISRYAREQLPQIFIIKEAPQMHITDLRQAEAGRKAARKTRRNRRNLLFFILKLFSSLPSKGSRKNPRKGRE